MNRTAASLALVPLLACGIPEAKYKAALDESGRNLKSFQEADERARAGAQRASELEAALAREKAAREAAAAEAAQAGALAARLARSQEQLQAEKAAMAAEADRQRQLAGQLAEQKSALEKRSAEYEALASSLDREIKAGQIQLSELKGRLTVRMAEKVLFASGSAAIGREGKEALGKIAAAFKDVRGRIIRVEGHTDDVPIRTARFPSNWELSSARAIAVVRLLQEKGVDPGLLGAAGYAQYQPVAPNDSAEGRAQNRRIEISLAPPLSALPAAPGS